MGLTIDQIPDTLAAEPDLLDWIEVHDTSLGRSVRMLAQYLPGRATNSLPVARLAASATDVLFGRSSAGAGAGEQIPCTPAGRQLLAVANIPAARAALDLEPGVDVQEWDAFLQSLADAADVAAVRALLDLEPGVDVQAYDAELAAIAGLISAADKVPYFTGAGTAALADFTAAGRALAGAADTAAQRVALGLVPGTDVQAWDSFLQSIADAANVAAVRALLGVAIGTDVQAYDDELAAIAGLTSAADKMPYFTGAGTAALADLTAFARTLMDDADATAARSTLGLEVGVDVQAYLASLTRRALTFVIGDGLNEVQAGTVALLRAEHNCTIAEATLLSFADDGTAPTGSIVIDIWKDTYANYPPTVADTITASAKPTLSSATKSQDSTLTGWTTTVTAGDILIAHVDSCSGVKQAILNLRVTLT